MKRNDITDYEIKRSKKLRKYSDYLHPLSRPLKLYFHRNYPHHCRNKLYTYLGNFFDNQRKKKKIIHLTKIADIYTYNRFQGTIIKL